jgi:hypothetical protein
MFLRPFEPMNWYGQGFDMVAFEQRTRSLDAR